MSNSPTNAPRVWGDTRGAPDLDADTDATGQVRRTQRQPRHDTRALDPSEFQLKDSDFGFEYIADDKTAVIDAELSDVRMCSCPLCPLVWDNILALNLFKYRPTLPRCPTKIFPSSLLKC